MRNKKIVSFLFAVLMISLSACAGTSNKRSFGQVVDDAVITNKLKAKYIKDKTVKAFKVDVDTHKGVVKLKGKVDNQEQIDRAIEIAERMPGVNEVKSYLIVKNRSEWSSQETSSNKRDQDLEEVDLKPATKKRGSSSSDSQYDSQPSEDDAGFVDESLNEPSRVTD